MSTPIINYPYWPEFSISESNEGGYTIVVLRTMVRIQIDETWYDLKCKDERLFHVDSMPGRYEQVRQFVEGVYRAQVLTDPTALAQIYDENGDPVALESKEQRGEVERLTEIFFKP